MINMGVFLRSALAMEIFCFSPPESVLFPTDISLSDKYSIPISRIMSLSSLSEALRLPRRIFSLTLPAKRYGSCSV